MPTEITVTRPDQLHQRVQNLARLKRRQVPDAIVDHLEATLPETAETLSAVELRHKHALSLAREEAAYIKLHPQLKLTHLGRYVAIYQGALIDEDDSFGTLVERVRHKLPHEVIWLTQVQEEPIQTIVKRGNHLVRNGE